MTAGDFAGRVAIVTGGSRGIGLACAHELTRRGATVIITSRTQEAADAAATAAGEGVVGFGAHAADPEAAAACVAFAVERFGRLDVLVNNAGTNPAFGSVVRQDRERVLKTFEVNVWAPAQWSGSACDAWMAEHGGAIVNTASLGGFMPSPDIGIYNASKAALVHLTRQMAVELAPRVRVNAVAPGVVRTKLSEALWEDAEQGQRVAAATPLGRLGEPEDVAQAVAFLASDRASWITGETLLVDGGQLLTHAAG